jgi:ABC-type sugar transport system substrate-binding protein
LLLYLFIKNKGNKTFASDVVLAAAEEKGVGMESLYAGEDSSKLIDCVAAARNSGKDAVLINLNAAEDAQACIEAAGDMKVVFINRVPADYGVLGDSAAAVASDEHFSGKYQGEFLADYFKKAGKTDVSYVLLRGTEGLVHTDLRTDGALNAMKDAGINLTEAKVIHANYNRVTARDNMADFLDDDVAFDCIISNNDAMALGAIAALKENVGESNVPIVGIDATDDGIEALKAGEMDMTVYQSHEGQASGGVQAAINMLEGKDIAEGTDCEVSSECPYVLYYPFIPVTADTLDQIKK